MTRYFEVLELKKPQYTSDKTRMIADIAAKARIQVASTLGVRREGVTEAAGNLQRAGYIRYRRGHISVLDRAGLESGVCALPASGLPKVIESGFPNWHRDLLERLNR